MLKYLFEAKYKDGGVYTQTQEDKSILHEQGSCYTDVKQDELKTFTLVGAGHSYSVDLEDGHFEVDGVSFFMHEMPLKNFRLIFWRRHRQSQVVRLKDHKITGTSEEIVYQIGWQSTLAGKNYQEVMNIE